MQRRYPTYRFDGRVALVTGAGDGIGLALVESLARGGARVVCLDVKGADAERALALGAAAAEAATMDVRDAAGV